MPGAMRSAATLALAVLCNAYKYHLTHASAADPVSSQAAFTLTEGPMFASGKGPFNTKGPSFISLDYRVSASAPSKDGATNQLNIWTIFVDAGTRPALGITVETAASRTTHYCCTPALFRDNACGPNVQIGGLIVHPTFASRPLPPPSLVTLSLSTPAGSQLPPSGVAAVNATGEAVEDGMQYALVAVCDALGSGLGMPAVDVDMDAQFKNPYGFLPGQVYGYLPFYGTLFVVYLLFALVYGIIAVRQRQYLLLLQYAIMGVIACGVFEMALFFFTYNAKNETGVPTPCKICGPPTGDYITALIVAVLKRAVSRSLLLAVALGFGVVHPKLSRRATLMTIGMGLAYLLFAVIDDISRETAYDAVPSVWELPVLFLDLCFVMGIYGGLQRLRRELRTAGQMAKLHLYNRLYAVLLANVCAWFIVVLVQVATRFGALPLHWSAYFLLFAFWDVLYLAVLVAVAWIWAPGESSFQYAWYAQSATNEAEAGDEFPSTASDAASNTMTPHTVAGSGDEGEGEGDIELAQAGVSRSAGRQEGPKRAGGQGVDGDEDEDDTEISFEHVERQAPKAAFSIGTDDLDEEDGEKGHTRNPVPVPAATASHPASAPAPAPSAVRAPSSSSASTAVPVLAAPRAGPTSSSSSLSPAPISPSTAPVTSSASGGGGGGLASQDALETIDDEAIIVDVDKSSGVSASASSPEQMTSTAAGSGSARGAAPKVPLLAPPRSDAASSSLTSASGTGSGTS